MSEINKLILKKISDCPENVRKVIRKALDLSAQNRETSVSEHLEGFIRDLTKSTEN